MEDEEMTPIGETEPIVNDTETLGETEAIVDYNDKNIINYVILLEGWICWLFSVS